MPWKAVGTKIIKADTGEVVGHSATPAKAKASVRARYANTKEGSKTGQRFAAMMKGK